MPRPSRSTLRWIFAGLLAWGILSLWVSDRWARSALEVGLFCLAAFCLATGGWRWNWRLGAVIFAAIWPLAQIAAGWTVYRHPTLEAALFWAAGAAAWLIAAHIFSDRSEAERLRTGMAWFGVGLAALAVVQLHTSNGRVFWLFDSGYRDNVLGPFVYRNNYAAFIELLFPIALFEAFAHGRRRVWLLAGSALMFASVAASGSRAGVLLMSVELAAVGALVWLRTKGGRSSITSLVWLLGLIALFAVVAGWGLLWDRFQEGAPLALRRHYLEASFDMMRERPWTGFGLGTWSSVYPAYARVDNGMFANRAHNDWAEWASEGGILFVAVLLLLVLSAVPRALRSVWGVGLISVGAHALIDYPFARLAQTVWWLVVLALVCALPRQHHPGGPDQDVEIQPE